MSTITPPELHGLLAIAREEGLDMKPVLLRVLTDLYIAADAHSSDEAAQFREIAGTLVPEVDTETALIVACKLAAYPATPWPVAEALLARGDDATRIVLADAVWLPRRTAVDYAAWSDRILAAAVAARADLDGDLARLLLGRNDPLIDVTLAANTGIALPHDVQQELLARSRNQEAIARALLSRNDLSGADRAVLFLEADRPARRSIIEEAERHALHAGRGPVRRAPDEVALPLEAAAMASDDDAFRQVLSLALTAAPAKVDRILADRTGEALALTLVALGIPDEVSTRIFMFRDPMIGHSTERCFALVDLSRRVSQAAAERIVTAMLGGDTRPRRAGTAIPVYGGQERGDGAMAAAGRAAAEELRRTLRA